MNQTEPLWRHFVSSRRVTEESQNSKTRPETNPIIVKSTNYSEYFTNTPQNLQTNMAQSHEKILQALLKAQNSQELSIIKLSEPVSGHLKSNSKERTSDVSTDVFDNPTPASLEEDLSHYKVYPEVLFLSEDTNAPAGTLLQTALFLPRTSHKGEVHTRHRR